MNSSVVALAFISVIVLAGSFVGFYAGSRRKMDLEQWIVGDRGFGMLLVWLCRLDAFDPFDRRPNSMLVLLVRSEATDYGRLRHHEAVI